MHFAFEMGDVNLDRCHLVPYPTRPFPHIQIDCQSNELTLRTGLETLCTLSRATLYQQRKAYVTISTSEVDKRLCVVDLYINLQYPGMPSRLECRLAYIYNLCLLIKKVVWDLVGNLHTKNVQYNITRVPTTPKV